MFKVTIKKGVDGRSKIKDRTSFKELFGTHPGLREGEVGCFLSHYEIWSDMIKKNIEYCCVYEDDVNFTSDYFNKLESIIEEIPEEFYILYIGGRFKDEHTTNNGINISKNIIQHGEIISRIDARDLERTTHGYIISIEGAKHLVECAKNTKIKNYQVDHFMINMFRKNEKQILSSQPLICWSPFYGDSDIRSWKYNKTTF
jgi:collagen beta-1,O-galactosyltransferase